ncbi:MAG: hypothetical protein P4L50_00310 [Anaerolineaceae bacterium]|nr:hypothetical protein [Anaerolineaceae bacterium]
MTIFAGFDHLDPIAKARRMRLVSLILSIFVCLFLASATAQTLNPPNWADGYINVQAGAIVNTTVINRSPLPNNLNILAQGAITTWNITLPNPAFDGELIYIGCPGGNVGTINIHTSDGSTIQGGAAPSCAAGTGVGAEYEFSSTANIWYYIAASIGTAPIASAAVVYADLQTGVDWCAKVTNAMALLPSTGGIVDARGLTGAQNCANGLTIPNNVSVLLGVTTLTVSKEIILNNYSSLICPAIGLGDGDQTGTAMIQQAAGSTLPYMVSVPGSFAGIENCLFDGNSANSTTSTALVKITGSHGSWEGASVQWGAGDNIQLISRGTSASTSTWKFHKLQTVHAVGRAFYCFGSSDSQFNQSQFEFSGGPGIELDNCNGNRFVNIDVGGNGFAGYNGPTGANTAATSPAIYQHGQTYVSGQFTGSSGTLFNTVNLGNNYGQDILIDGTVPTQSGTVGGTISSGDVNTLTFAGTYLNGGASVIVSYTAQPGDTATQVAAGLAAAIVANATLVGYEIGATAASGALTVYIPEMLQTVASAGAAPTATNVTVTYSTTGAETLPLVSGYATGGASQISIDNITSIGGPRTSNLFSSIEIYNSHGGNNIVSNSRGTDQAAHTYASYIDIHGVTGQTGYDTVNGASITGTWPTPTFAGIFVGVPVQTSIKQACSNIFSIPGCFSSETFFQATKSGSNVLTASTLGASAGDSNAIVAINPSTATYGYVNIDAVVGTQQVSSRHAAVGSAGGGSAGPGTVYELTANASGALQIAEQFGGVPLGGSNVSCPFSQPSGYATRGTIKITSTCSAGGTITLQYFGSAPHGWMARILKNDTTSGDQPTSSLSTSTASTVTMAFPNGANANDIIEYEFAPE